MSNIKRILEDLQKERQQREVPPQQEAQAPPEPPLIEETRPPNAAEPPPLMPAQTSAQPQVTIHPLTAAPAEIPPNMYGVVMRRWGEGPPQIKEGGIAFEAVHDGETVGHVIANPFNKGDYGVYSVSELYVIRGGGEQANSVEAAALRGLAGALAGEAQKNGLAGADLDGMPDGYADRFRNATGADQPNSPFRLIFSKGEDDRPLCDLRVRPTGPQPPIDHPNQITLQRIDAVPDYMIDAFIQEARAPSEDRKEIREAGMKWGVYHRGYLAGFTAGKITGKTYYGHALYIEPSARGAQTQGQPTTGEQLTYHVIEEAKEAGVTRVSLGPLAAKGEILMRRIARKWSQDPTNNSKIEFHEEEDRRVYAEIQL
ncbi:Uncharacterised protein [uncultured archaeon]|nr:Uncharacterised protein [uncultured archaeon]